MLILYIFTHMLLKEGAAVMVEDRREVLAMRWGSQAVVQSQWDRGQFVPEIVLLLRKHKKEVKIWSKSTLFSFTNRTEQLKNTELHKSYSICLCSVWFAHSQVDGVAQAWTWAVVSQFQEPCALRLLRVQEQNSLNSASVAFQPVQLQLCSQVWTGSNDKEVKKDGEVREKHWHWEWNSRSRNSLTVESTRSFALNVHYIPLVMK